MFVLQKLTFLQIGKKRLRVTIGEKSSNEPNFGLKNSHRSLIRHKAYCFFNMMSFLLYTSISPEGNINTN